MKKVALILALFGTLLAGAQTKDTLRMNVNGNEIIILTDDVNNLDQTDFNAIIQRLTAETQRIVAEYNKEIAEINRQQQAGAITAEEANEQRDAATEKMEDDMEALNDEIENWADRYGEQVEENADDPNAWKNQWESNAEKYETANPPAVPSTPAPPAEKKGTTVIINDDGVHIDGDEDWDPDDVRKKREDYLRNQTIGYFEMYFGWNNWFNADGIATNNGPGANGLNMTTELNFWPSMTWGFGFGGRTRFGTSMMHIRYGLQFNWHYFQLKGNNILTKSADQQLNFDGIHFLQDNSHNYGKTTYRITYLDFPVLLELNTSKPGHMNGFSLSAGGYGGFRINSRRILDYSDFNGDKTTDRTYNSFYTNGFRYGLMAQAGIGTFKITGKYDLSTLFRTDKNTPDYQIGSITLGWVFP